jgi:hypothetical protein
LKSSDTNRSGSCFQWISDQLSVTNSVKSVRLYSVLKCDHVDGTKSFLREYSGYMRTFAVSLNSITSFHMSSHHAMSAAHRCAKLDHGLRQTIVNALAFTDDCYDRPAFVDDLLCTLPAIAVSELQYMVTDINDGGVIVPNEVDGTACKVLPTSIPFLDNGDDLDISKEILDAFPAHQQFFKLSFTDDIKFPCALWERAGLGQLDETIAKLISFCATTSAEWQAWKYGFMAKIIKHAHSLGIETSGDAQEDLAMLWEDEVLVLRLLRMNSQMVLKKC